MQSCRHITIAPYMWSPKLGRVVSERPHFIKKKSGYLALAHLHNSSGNYDNSKGQFKIFYDPLVVFHDLVILFKLVIFYVLK